MKAADSTWIEPSNPAYNAVPMETQAEKAALQQQANSEQQRLQRLEQDVNALQNDLDMIVPALQKIVVHQQQQQNSGQIHSPPRQQPYMAQSSTNAPQNMMPPQQSAYASNQPASLSAQGYAAAPSSASAPSAPAQQASAPVRPLSMVQSIRFGEHTNKTRMVFDSTAPISYKYAVNEQNNQLVIRMPQTEWSAQSSQMIRTSNAVSSYSVLQNNEGGVDVVVQLKRPVRVSTEMLSPQSQGGGNGYRIFFDLMPI